jgi:hypothetical protein
MGIMTKRNALVGWAVWKVGKRVIKRKAKSAVPGTSGSGGGRAGKAALVAGLAAAIGGVLFLWRRKSGADETPES